jgi:cystathionine beta-lyase/cystathionine gamma-synthase
MLFNKLFGKSFEYIYFDNLKKDFIKTHLSEKEVNDLSQKEFSNDKASLNHLISQLSEHLTILPEKEFSLFNQKIFQVLQEEIISLSEEVKQLNLSEKVKFQQVAGKYRELFKTFIALITNQSWQSPDFGNSIMAQHGIFQKRIYSFYNDYQRYRVNTSVVEKNFNSFNKEIAGINPKTWLFNSGMGAFNTLLQSLPDFHNSVKLAGNNLYFEVLSLLKYHKNIFFINEENTNEIISFIQEKQPDYLFFDPVANSARLPVFNFKHLFEYYKKIPPEKPVSIIIDITLTLHFFDVTAFFTEAFPNNLNIFLYRSLQKLDQNGLDMVTGGIITHYGNLNLPLDGFRQLGTTPTETEVLTVEYLGTEFTENRFIRHCRNTLLIAGFLNKKNKGSILESVQHPFLQKNIPDKSYLQVPLCFFSLKDYFNLEDCNFFLSELIRISKIKNFNIIAGTSFGFNFSRIMITTFPDSSAICFRFSAGNEILEDVYILLEVLDELLNTFVINLKTAYENKELPLLQNKLELYQKSLEKIAEEKQLNADYCSAIIRLLHDLNSHLLKFRNYKATRKFYNAKTEEIAGPLLQIINQPGFNITDDLKKELIRSVALII